MSKNCCILRLYWMVQIIAVPNTKMVDNNEENGMQFVVYVKEGGVVMLKRLWDWANKNVAKAVAIPLIGFIVILAIISHFPSILSAIESLSDYRHR